jgi:LmbE family N-acetylglucosaminyl deacetylase
VIPNPAGAAEVLVVRYWYDWRPDAPDARPQVKFPGGSRRTGQDDADASPADSLARELREEVFMNGVGAVLRLSPLHAETLSTAGRPDHIKHFFLVHDFDGDLRREDLFELEQGTAEKPDGPARTERMAPPEFIDVATLARVIFRSHGGALRAYCQQLTATDAHAGPVAEALAILNRRSGRQT